MAAGTTPQACSALWLAGPVTQARSALLGSAKRLATPAGRWAKNWATALPLTNITASYCVSVRQASARAAGSETGPMVIRGKATASTPKARKSATQSWASLAGRVTMARGMRRFARSGPAGAEPCGASDGASGLRAPGVDKRFSGPGRPRRPAALWPPARPNERQMPNLAPALDR